MNNSLVNAMVKENNYTNTENGALTYKSTTNYLLDWFGLGAALRMRTEADKICLFSKAFAEDKLSALKVLFYIRDIRGGQGERSTFRTCLKWLANNYPNIVVKNMENIPFYGRWDDLFVLDGTSVEREMYEYYGKSLISDFLSMKMGNSISLCAKWAKSENTSCSESRRLAHKLRKSMVGFSSKDYRKLLKKLRSYSNVVEAQMCSKQWDQIDFGKVPSKASLLYKKAFNKHESERYGRYLNAVANGEAKMNAGAVYPYEILRSILNCGDETSIKSADLQWKNQPNWLENNPHYGLVVADVSGSMTCNNSLPLLVSISLAIYFAERNVGPFTNKFLTFTDNSTLQEVIGNNLKEKYENLSRADWAGSTNIQSAFEQILQAAVKHNVPKSEMPSVLYIISDMEFNSCCEGTNYESMKQKFINCGYDLPKVVFWNVNARNNQSPITVDDSGTCLVSGCSPSILKSVLSGKDFSPLSVLLETINSDRYNKVVV